MNYKESPNKKSNPWKNMEMAPIYNAMLSKDPNQAMLDLINSRKQLEQSAELSQEKRIEAAGNALMQAIRNNFNEQLDSFKEEYGCRGLDNLITELKADRGFAIEVLLNNKTIEKFIEYVEEL